jgi:hypothetical protein
MGSTTPKTKAASPAVDDPSKIADKTKNTLQQYLDKVYTALRGEIGPDLGTKTHVAISIFLQKKGSGHLYAGKFDDEHQFSGSLLKVAAMFAAYKLRKEALDLAVKVNNGTVKATTPTLFFDELKGQFDLNKAVKGIRDDSQVNKKPRYTEILSATGFPSAVKVEFTLNFKEHMRKMMLVSDNCSAGECIVRLGYPYINVKLIEDKFFDETTWDKPTPKGIWLAGDYIIVPPEPGACFNASKKLHYIRVTTTNDCNPGTNFCGSAQNTSSREMARLYLKILERKLVDPNASQEMFDLMHEAQEGDDSSFVSRVPGILFTVDAVKIGIGPLKPDPERAKTILSEGIIITWNIADAAEQKLWDDKHLTSKAAICWQNLNNLGGLKTGVAKIINQTISKFIIQEAL